MENTTNPENAPVENSIAGYHDEIAQIHQEGMELGVKKARNALFWTGGLILFWEAFGLIRDGYAPDPLLAGIIIFIVAAFVGLALWTKKKPYTAIILGLVLFFAYWALGVAAFYYTEGSTGIVKALFSGIIIKVVILVTLFRALGDAKELQQIKSERSL